MTTPAPRPARHRTDRWQIAALALSVLASLLLLILPVFGGTSATESSDGTQAERTVTLLESEGVGVLIPLSIPALLMLIPLYPTGRARRWVNLASTVLFAAFALLSLLSVGIFYLPALVCSIAATTAAMTAPRQDD